MKLSITEDPNAIEPEVSVRCARIDARVQRVIAAAQQEERKLVGVADGFVRSADPADVLYVETVDGRTFLYTRECVLESAVPVSVLEEELAAAGFVRASRQLLVNLRHVQGMRPYLNARLELVLDNGEHLIASRQFAPQIKQRIGL